MTTAITIPTTKELEHESSALVGRAKTLAVYDQLTADQAGWLIDQAGLLDAQIEALLAEPKRAAHKTHKAVCALETKLRAIPKEAKRIASEKVRVWLDEQRRQREEMEVRLAAEARRQAEEDQMRRAELAATVGGEEAGLAVLEEPVETPPVVLPSSKVEGVIERRIVDFEIVDAMALPREYLMPNEQAIRARVRAMGMLAAIPGVRTFMRTSVVRQATSLATGEMIF